jgi:H/ACA ribonucleoprotein complex subunit 3
MNKMELKKCRRCGRYTFMEKCPKCGEVAVRAAPPKFSPQDRWGEYRRKLKKLEGKNELC